jgi:hypothetical protein
MLGAARRRWCCSSRWTRWAARTAPPRCTRRSRPVTWPEPCPVSHRASCM